MSPGMLSRRLPLLMLLASGQSAAATMTCHIHLPADHPLALGRPALIPNVGDRQACEQLNRELFGQQGRCHCSFSPLDNGPQGSGRSAPGRPSGEVPPTLP